MKTNLSLSHPAEVETECLVAIVLDRAEKGRGEKEKVQVSIETPDAAVKDAAADVIAGGEVTGKPFETTLAASAGETESQTAVASGRRQSQDFFRIRLAPPGRRCRAHAQIERTAQLRLPRARSRAEDARTRSKPSWKALLSATSIPTITRATAKTRRLTRLTVVARGDQARLQAAVDEARVVGESQNFTRDLVNEPSNRMTPTILAERAKKMAAEVGLKCEVYGEDKIKELKMGAFWSVAQGSDEPPALIVLRYEPAGAPEKPVLGLVGKGITFDTGGISIKPADGMEKMKYDMAGGATMIGAMRAIALLKPKLKITAIILATENMPSGKAQKPGDVQIAMSGKSIEIINTDAEGRLVLADGLYYARQLGCTHLIDAATLTGAVVVALGSINAGIFANDDAMYDRFSKALDAAGEKMWRLPLDEEYKEIIRSNIADIVNSGGRYGGAITAAMFLKEFAEDTPWLHLDIAGTAWTEEQKPWIAKGPSGIALRSLVEFARDFADSKG